MFASSWCPAVREHTFSLPTSPTDLFATRGLPPRSTTVRTATLAILHISLCCRRESQPAAAVPANYGHASRRCCFCAVAAAHLPLHAEPAAPNNQLLQPKVTAAPMRRTQLMHTVIQVSTCRSTQLLQDLLCNVATCCRRQGVCTSIC
jgi:hypothetical protein